MNVISSHADHVPEHLRFSREMNRRDGSYLERSSAPFRRDILGLLCDAGAVLSILSKLITARLHKPYPKFRSF